MTDSLDRVEFPRFAIDSRYDAIITTGRVCVVKRAFELMEGDLLKVTDANVKLVVQILSGAASPNRTTRPVRRLGPERSTSSSPERTIRVGRSAPLPALSHHTRPRLVLVHVKSPALMRSQGAPVCLCAYSSQRTPR